MAANQEQKVGPAAGRTVIITGCNTGIGKVTALDLAQKGYHVIMANRSEEKTRPVLDDIVKRTGNKDVEFMALDLASLRSVREFAAAVDRKGLQKVHILINNAGLAQAPEEDTVDGFESTFAVNHLGHFLLTLLLLPKIKAAAPSRIVVVASKAHYKADGIPFESIPSGSSKPMVRMSEYFVSKLANVLFANELARKLQGTGVTVNSLHPGVVATDIWRAVPGIFRWCMKSAMLSPEEGARSTIFAATAPELNNVSGKYFDYDCNEKEPSKVAQDRGLAARLWEKSLEWCKVTPAEVAACGFTN